MVGPKKLFNRDADIQAALASILKVIKQHHLERDKRGPGKWFANAQLDDLRKVLEKMGFETARIFQRGKLEKGGNHWERKKNEVLLRILEVLGQTPLDIVTCSYMLGKLNSIIDEFERKENDDVKRN